MSKAWLEQAGIITEALPYIKRYSDKIVVVKYGGNAMNDETTTHQFAKNIAILKQIGIKVVVVHGGGPQIGKMLETLNIKTEFKEGLRVTNQESMNVAEMVLSGSINKHLTSALNAVGVRAIGISAKDNGIVKVEKVTGIIQDTDSNIEKNIDWGLVGKPVDVDVSTLKILLDGGITPVVSPVGLGIDGKTYNVNADSIAGAIAGSIQAKRLFLLTDIVGLLDKNKQLVSVLNVAGAKRLLKDGTITGGMIPKIETCIDSIQAGLEAGVIIDGRVEHALLLEIFTQRGIGTLIKAV